MNPIYLDYNATTPLDPAVFEAMLPYLREHYGNPSSAHSLGQIAHDAVEHARRQVADLLHAHPDEIVFTGGGSEASNLALKGVAFARPDGAHVVVSSVEHPATTQPCEFLKRLGCRVTVVPVDGRGCVDPDAVGRAVSEGAALVSIMHSNNEVGTLQPIKEIAALTRAKGVLLHTDAAQSTGKLPLDVDELGVDLLTVAGHKLYAPKGVGVLYVRRGVKLEPLIHGAGHEGGRRAGTENVPYIVGLGMACEIARRSLPAASERLRQLRDRLVGPAAGGPRRPCQPQRPSGKALAEHAQRQLRGVRRLGAVGEDAGGGGLDRLGLPRGPGRVVAGAGRDGRAAGAGPRGVAADGRPLHDGRRDRPGGVGPGPKRGIATFRVPKPPRNNKFGNETALSP